LEICFDSTEGYFFSIAEYRDSQDEDSGWQILNQTETTDPLIVEHLIFRYTEQK